jgi:hypothetical protein
LDCCVRVHVLSRAHVHALHAHALSRAHVHAHHVHALSRAHVHALSRAHVHVLSRAHVHALHAHALSRAHVHALHAHAQVCHVHDRDHGYDHDGDPINQITLKEHYEAFRGSLSEC